MTRLPPIDRANVQAETQKLLDGVERKLGMLPNILATMAHSPATLKAYLGFSQSLSDGEVSARLREQIALAISQINDCDYCLAAHSAIGSSLGITSDEIRDARSATSPDRKTDAALQFAVRIVDKRGAVSDSDIQEVRNAGFGDSEIVEIIAQVALITFTNYFNKTARTENDFPAVAQLVAQ